MINRLLWVILYTILTSVIFIGCGSYYPVEKADEIETVEQKEEVVNDEDEKPVDSVESKNFDEDVVTVLSKEGAEKKLKEWLEVRGTYETLDIEFHEDRDGMYIFVAVDLYSRPDGTVGNGYIGEYGVDRETGEIVDISEVLLDGDYKYYDSEYGYTTLKIDDDGLSLNGDIYKDNEIVKTGEMTIKLAEDVYILGWVEGESKSITKYDFSAWVTAGASIEFTVKNNEVIKIDVNPYSG